MADPDNGVLRFAGIVGHFGFVTVGGGVVVFQFVSGESRTNVTARRTRKGTKACSVHRVFASYGVF
jgi:hypothetical protein